MLFKAANVLGYASNIPKNYPSFFFLCAVCQVVFASHNFAILR